MRAIKKRLLGQTSKLVLTRNYLINTQTCRPQRTFAAPNSCYDPAYCRSRESSARPQAVRALFPELFYSAASTVGMYGYHCFFTITPQGLQLGVEIDAGTSPGPMATVLHV